VIVVKSTIVLLFLRLFWARFLIFCFSYPGICSSNYTAPNAELALDPEAEGLTEFILFIEVSKLRFDLFESLFRLLRRLEGLFELEFCFLGGKGI